MNSNYFESLDTQSSNSNIWTKFEPHMQTEVIHSGELSKHSKGSTGDLSKRYFILQRDYLLYKKDAKSTSVSSAMYIKYARLVLPGLDENDQTPSEMLKASYPLKICYKNKYSLLYASSEEEYNLWVAAFTSNLTRTDFHSRFTVSKIIGSGAFANVYESTEKSTGIKFAVKGFNKLFLENDANGKQALWNEITVMKGLNQKNLLTLHELHETKNSIYLVFDIIGGGELAKLMDSNKKGLPEADVINIMYGLLKGLECLYDRGIAHRDLKPANIMLRKTKSITSEDVVIVDFGLAAGFTETNLIYKRCGTPGYIAPEVIAAKNVEQHYEIPRKSDIFSIGVIMYVLCAGSNPFEKSEYNVETILKKNLDSKVPYPSEVFGKYNVELVKLLQGLLATDPKNRLTAKDALNLKVFGGNREASDIEVDIDEFGDDTQSISLSIGTYKSFLNNKNGYEGQTMSNNSIGVNSRGFLENKDAGPNKKVPHTNLYKKSLMKGMGSVLSGASAGSKERSVENSPAHSVFSSGSRDSLQESTSTPNSQKSANSKTSGFSSAMGDKKKQSCFASGSKKE
jgi:serine/threonine protein kinase